MKRIPASLSISRKASKDSFKGFSPEKTPIIAGGRPFFFNRWIKIKKVYLLEGLFRGFFFFKQSLKKGDEEDFFF